MGFTGLSSFKEKQEQKTYVKQESPFFKLEPGQKVKIRPLVELDENGKNYDADKGHANFVKEYVNPVKFWLKITDTYDPEANISCVGHEMVQRFGWYKQKDADPEKKQHSNKTKNWNPKVRFYLPVLVDRLDGSEPTVEVLQNTYGAKSPSQTLVDFYEDEEKRTIVDRWWTYSRNNATEMNDVVYKFVPGDPDKFDTSKFEIPNVNDAPYVNNIPYEDQYAYLQIDATYGNESAPAQESAPASSSSSSNDEDGW